MAREVYSFQVLTPAGTAKATPQATSLSMPPRRVIEVDIRVPPGPNGVMGFAIGAAGVPIIPLVAGQFIVTDDEPIHWPLENQLDSGAWQAFTYNTGTFPHTLYVRVLVDLPGQAGGVAAWVPIPAGQLVPSG